MNNLIKMALWPLLLVILAGCAATQTTLSKRHVDVQTQTSGTVFLDPVAEDDRTLYVEVRNSSGQSSFNLEHAVKTALYAKGYQIVSNPQRANFLLQANVLQVNKATEEERDEWLATGYGGAVTGGAAGAAIGYATSGGDADNAVVGAVIGAAVGAVLEATVQDVYYTAMADVRVSQRTEEGWSRHQTRVMSVANKGNLQLEEAADQMAQDMAASIANNF